SAERRVPRFIRDTFFLGTAIKRSLLCRRRAARHAALCRLRTAQPRDPAASARGGTLMRRTDEIGIPRPHEWAGLYRLSTGIASAFRGAFGRCGQFTPRSVYGTSL